MDKKITWLASVNMLCFPEYAHDYNFMFICLKVNEMQSTVPVKKSKKKTKTNVKAAPSVSKNDGRDPDDGTTHSNFMRIYNFHVMLD